MRTPRRSRLLLLSLACSAALSAQAQASPPERVDVPAGDLATALDTYARQLLDWRSGMLSFRDATLAEAAGEFNRYNARKIVIGDAAVGQLRIGGSFRWSNAEGFVRLLEQGFPVRADYGTDRIVLRSP